MGGRKRGRQKTLPQAEKKGFATYLRRLTPFALLSFPFWLALPFIVDSDRLALFLSGTMPLWKLMLWLTFVAFVSFLSSASIDWDERRKANKERGR